MVLQGIDLERIWMRTTHAYRNRNWRTWKIKENGDPLVVVPKDWCIPWYSSVMGLTSESRIFLRREVAEMLEVARGYAIGKGYELMVLDGWRPVELQETLFWHYMKLFTAPRFKFDIFASCTSVNDVRACFHSLDLEKQEELKQANRTYVSWPSTDPASPSPHFTGGSVDVWLYEDKTMADLGVPFDWMEENAGAFYHLRVDRQVFSDDEGVCRRRTILLNAMLRAGFTAYPPEIWHFNYGNQMDAMVKGLSEACYSGTHP